METHTNIEKSGLEPGSFPSTREEALKMAIERLKESFGTKTSNPPSQITVAKSNLPTTQPSKRRASIAIDEEVGESEGERTVPAKLAKMSTNSLQKMLNAGSDDEVRQAHRALVLRADQGDELAYRAIRDDFDHVYAGLSTSGRTLLKSLAQFVVGDERKIQQVLLAKGVVETRDDLAGPDSSPLEKLLAERIAICQATLECMETIFFQDNRIGIHSSILHQNRISMVQSRLIQAVRALAQVRKLQIPNVQVNIGEKQVNLA
jgi:hypothetical protein